MYLACHVAHLIIYECSLTSQTLYLTAMWERGFGQPLLDSIPPDSGGTHLRVLHSIGTNRVKAVSCSDPLSLRSS